MKLNELPLGYKIIVQINLGEQLIEFESVVIERDMEGVVISPYMHQGFHKFIQLLTKNEDKKG